MSHQNYPQNTPSHLVPHTSTNAVISLIAGIASFIIVPLIGGIAAIIFGKIAKNEIRQGQGRVTGDGMATFGSVLGWINVAIVIIPICFMFVILPVFIMITGFIGVSLGL